ncbi:MAG: hypothetical protein V3S69_05095 [Dehalococcoidales bacterium]
MGFGSFFKKLTKPFKKIAKKIKKTAGKLTGSLMKLPGFKQLGQLYGKTFGKLGPLGMIAASFVMPGLGSLFSGAWGSALGGNYGAMIQAAAKGLQSVGTTLGGVGTSITEKISGAWNQIGGGNFTKGITDTFQKASDWVTGGKAPSEFNLGVKPGSITGAQVAGPQSQFSLGMDKFDTGAFTGVQDTSIDAMMKGTTTPQNLIGQVGPSSAFNLPEVAPGAIARTNVTASGAVDVTTNAAMKASKGTSFAKKALKGAASSLLAQGQAPIDTPFAGVAAGSLDAFGSQRAGAGGVGSTGGQFLTPQQQAFFQQHASLLGQQG